MFHMRSSRNAGQGVRAWRDNRARPLSVAANLARQQAALEHLPVTAAPLNDAERWFAETLVKTVPVSGARNGLRERVPAGADVQFDAQSQRLSSGEAVWSDLAVEREDFARYMDWLRSVW